MPPRALTPERLGCVNSVLAPWSFLDDDIFLTKAGDAGRVYRLHGVDAEALDEPTRAQLSARVALALRQLDPTVRLYQYLVKRPTAAVAGRAVSTIELYWAFVAEYPRRGRAPRWQHVLRPRRAIALEYAQLRATAATVRRQAEACLDHLSDARPTPLTRQATFAFLRALVNDDAIPADVPLPALVGVDYLAADSSIEVEPDHLLLGNTRVTVLTMKETPDATTPFLLDAWAAVPGTFLLCVEWKRLSPEAARAELRFRSRFFHMQALRPSMPATMLGGAAAPEYQLIDESMAARRAQSQAALTATEAEGHVLGECSLTVVVRHETTGETAAGLSKLIAARGGALAPERINLLSAWLATVPGNSSYNHRRRLLLGEHVADMSLLAAPDTGRAVDDAGRPPVATLITQRATPYRFHLHVDDVGHTLVLGASSGGKTVTVNTLADGAQAYGGHTVLFDLRAGYRALAARHGGLVTTFRSGETPALNPFHLPPGPETAEFLAAWCGLLLEGPDHQSLSARERQAVHTAVEATLAPAIPWTARRLGSMRRFLPPPLRARLQAWVADDRYGHVFDHPAEVVQGARLQVFELGPVLDEMPAVIEPLLLYILRRVTARLDPAVFTFCALDEAWRFVTHPTLRAFITDAIKTWRKRNGTMVLATQNLEDLADHHGFLRTIIEGCPTTLFVANPGLDPALYRDTFHMNDREIALLQGLQSQKQVLLHRATGAKVLDLVLPPDTPWLHQEIRYA